MKKFEERVYLRLKERISSDILCDIYACILHEQENTIDRLNSNIKRLNDQIKGIDPKEVKVNFAHIEYLKKGTPV